MMGLFAVFLSLAWVAIVFAVVILVTLMLPKRWWRTLIRVVLVLVLIPIPLVDEYFGKAQFENMCKEKARVHMAPNAAGKTVYLQEPQRADVPGTWVPISTTAWRFVDAATGEVIVSYDIVQALGGRFTRGLSEGGAPYSFTGYCAPKGAPRTEQAFQKLGIKYVEPPKKRTGG